MPFSHLCSNSFCERLVAFAVVLLVRDLFELSCGRDRFRFHFPFLGDVVRIVASLCAPLTVTAHNLLGPVHLVLLPFLGLASKDPFEYLKSKGGDAVTREIAFTQRVTTRILVITQYDECHLLEAACLESPS